MGVWVRGCTCGGGTMGRTGAARFILRVVSSAEGPTATGEVLVTLGETGPEDVSGSLLASPGAREGTLAGRG